MYLNHTQTKFLSGIVMLFITASLWSYNPTSGNNESEKKAGPTVTINQANDQNDPEVSLNQARFTAIFSESVTGFETGDVTIDGATGATTGAVTEIAPNDGTTYEVKVTGLVIGGAVSVVIPADVANAVNGGLGNLGSTSSDNKVTVGTEIRVLGAGEESANGLYTRRGIINNRDHYSNGSFELLYFGQGNSGNWLFNIGTSSYRAFYAHFANQNDSPALRDSPSEGDWNYSAGVGGSTVPTLELLLPDRPAQPTVTINQASDQNDPEISANQARFTAVFSEPVTGFENGEVTIAGATGATTSTVTEIAPNDGTTYEVAITGFSTGGAVRVRIPADVAASVSTGLTNVPSTSTDNLVTLGTEIRVLGAGIESANGIYTSQGLHNDKTHYSNGNFQLFYHKQGVGGIWVFNEDLGPSSFVYVRSGNSDDSPTQTDWLYAIGVGASTTPTLELLLPDRPARPTVTINQASDQNDPEVSINQARFTAVFSEPVTGFENGDVTIAGATGATTSTITEVAPNDGTTYEVSITDLSFGGGVRVRIPADVATSVSTGLANVPSTSTDNLVTVGTEIRVVGAGQESADGLYVHQGLVNGRDHYSNGVYDLHYYLQGGGGIWVINDGTSSYRVLYIRLSNSDDSPTQTGWLPSGGVGADVAPTLQVLLPDRPTEPTVTINQASDQNDPEISMNQARFTAVFSDAVTGFENGDVVIKGATGATTSTVTEVAPNDGTTYEITVSGLSIGGVVSVKVPADVAKSVSAGVNNVPSLSTDNKVTVGTEVRVLGAGVELANGLYAWQDIVNGRDHYSNGTYDLYYYLQGGGGIWLINDGASSYNPVYARSGNSDNSPTETGWHSSAGIGSSTIPTLDLLLPDRPAQPTVTINQASDQNDPEISMNQARFTAVFSEPVADFENGDVTIVGATGATTSTITEVAPNDGTTYEVKITGLSIGGGVRVRVPADVANAVSTGLTNVPSTSTDNVVTVGTEVRVLGGSVESANGLYTRQGVLNGRDHYSNGSHNLFYYLQSRGGIWIINTDVNTYGARYIRSGNSDYSPTQTDWLYTAGVGAGIAPSLELLLPDRPPQPTVTINQASDQNDPEISLNKARFTAVFSEPVAGFENGEVTILGATGAALSTVTEVAPNDGTTYEVAITGLRIGGGVRVRIPADVATSVSTGLTNVPSTSTDNVVTVGTEIRVMGSDVATANGLYTRQGVVNGRDHYSNGNFQLFFYRQGVGGIWTINEDLSPNSFLYVRHQNSGDSPTETGWLVQGGGGGTTPPTMELLLPQLYPSITSDTPGFTNEASFDITITFSADVSDFEASDINVGNGTLSGFAGSGSVYTATVSPTAEGAVDVDVNAEVATDSEGKKNAAAPRLTIVSDKTGPTITISRADGLSVSGAFDVTFTFNEDVMNFDASDIVVSNGTVGSLSGSGAIYTTTITPLAEGTVTVDLAAAVAKDLAGNDNTTAARLSIQNDETAPTVAISSTASGIVNGPFDISITFSEAVVDFALEDLSVSNGVASNFSGSGSTYSATITPSADGAVTIDIASGISQDIAGNDNTAASQFSISSDLSVPTVTITSAASNPVMGAFDVTITFSEDVTNFTIADLTVGNGTAGNFSGSGAAYTATITPTADGTITVDLSVGAAQDLGGNDNTAATQFSVQNEENVPSVTITSIESGLVIGTFGITVTFSEIVTGFSSADLLISNGSVFNFSGIGSTYTATIAPMSDGIVTIDIGNGAAKDGANNNNTAATQFSIEYDQTRPTVIMTAATGSITNGPFDLTITFSEVVTGFDLNDIRVTGGSASDFSGSGALYSATITPSVGVVELAVDIDAATAQDLAGHKNVAASQFDIANDEKVPFATISSSFSGLISGEFSITVGFSEAIIGFDASDLRVINGTVGSITNVHNAYTVVIVPFGDGSVIVNLDSDKVHDMAGNGNTAATQFSIVNDQSAPELSITSSVNGPINSPFDVSINFNEDVIGFDISDIEIINGVASNFSGSGKAYTATITPTADGKVVVFVRGSDAKDPAGNGNIPSARFSIISDLTKPTVSVTSSSSDLTNGVFDITATFSETVIGFDINDLTVGNATVGNFSGSGSVYTATITPLADGTVTVDVAAAVVQDAVGNVNTAATQFSIENDETSPTVVISSMAGVITNAAIDITITFSEDVTGFALTDLTVGNGSAGNLAGSGAAYTATITPSADGTVTVDIAAAIAQDAASNTNTATSQFSIEYDQTVPTVAMSTAVGDSTSGAFDLTITFSETVTGFDLSSLALTNGTASNFSGSNALYSVTITPSAHGVTVTADIHAESVQDLAGNKNSAAPRLSVINDELAPEGIIFGVSKGPVRGEFVVGIVFEEVINGFEVSDLTVTNGIAGAVIFTESLNLYEIFIEPLADGPVLVDFDSDKVQDAAGNGNTALEQFSIINDETAPTVVISSGASDPVNAAFDITITFSEDVTGLVVGDLTVGNGTAGNLAGSGAIYTATITPSADGAVTVDVAAAVAQDEAGNTSVAATQLTIQADITAPAAPVITGISDDTGSDNTDRITSDNALIFTGTAEVNSIVEVFIGGSTIGTTTADGSGNWTFDHSGTNLADGNYSITATATDAADNASATSTVLSLTIDTEAPDKPVLTAISEDRGISSTDLITSDVTLVYFGTAEPFSTLELKSGPFTLLSTTVDANGDWVGDFTHRSITSPITLLAITTDMAGNVSVNSDANFINIDVAAPEVVSIVRADANPTSATSVNFTVTFSEETHGLSTSSFALALTGTQNANIVSVSNSSGTSITVTVNNITGEGSFGLNLSDLTGITDVAGNALAGTFTGEVYNTNFTPTDISLSASSILENNTIGDLVASLSTTDTDAGDTHVYSLATGTGDTDNASFTISGGDLKAAETFDLETKASYDIRLKTDDGRGGAFEKAFTITIDNVPEADMRITGDLNIPATPLGITTTFDITIHNDGDATLTVGSILYPTAFGGPVSGISIAPGGNQLVTLSFTPTAAQLYTGDITIVSNGGTGILSVSADGAIITSVDNGLLKAESINVYPNPASDILTIDLSKYNGRALNIQLYDLSGIKSFSISGYKQNTLRLDISSYHSGVYLIQLNDGESTVQKKVMIRK